MSENEDKVVRPNFGGPVEKKSKEHRQNRIKQDLFSGFASKGDKVMVTFDPRTEGVEVPDRFRSNTELKLNFSYWFKSGDFEWNDEGVRSSLQFNGIVHYCVVPWKAITGIYSHENDVQYHFPKESNEQIQN